MSVADMATKYFWLFVGGLLLIGVIGWYGASIWDYAQHCPNETTAIATICLVLVGAVTIIAIIWQGSLVRTQLELQTLANLYEEWNSKQMLRKRAHSFFIDEKSSEGDLEKVEAVLEFLEKLASYYRHRVLTKSLIWDTFGWYILRYYFHNSGNESFPDQPANGNIERIRVKWGNDKTLYCDLQKLYGKLLWREMFRRRKWKTTLRTHFRMEREKFIEAEKTLYEDAITDNHGTPESATPLH